MKFIKKIILIINNKIKNYQQEKQIKKILNEKDPFIYK